MAAGGGGAWKVAFADFMTAMMALFLVLWISAQDKKILIATSKYFQSPFSSPMEDHSGVMPFNKQSSENSSSSEDSSGKDKAADKNKQIELSFLNSVAADFYRLLHLDQTLDQKPIDIQVTSDGLRLTLFDRSSNPLFKENSAEFTDWGINMIQSLAWLIDRHHFRVTIDGHTKAGLKLPDEGYTDWELSSDRANAARRKLVLYAVEPELIERVTGYAATRPLPKEDPAAEANQRITLSLALSSKNRAKLEPLTTPGEAAAKPVAVLTP
ncbi:flagellar motor protein MotB [Oleiharenicola lentus]|jgi:chemotaxis protein MotB|uniref:Flagellar motor protein MotB n=1 Tax=Oleiharenicola lentus TaxID=2508720 RepID=A0A4Q1C3X0_9BACT|nr:flagellar motor protein MotB [Oleiharenicola lentus]RXK52949.1 flagellar motor protein MotB [Oleiharenicola lentus]